MKRHFPWRLRQEPYPSDELTAGTHHPEKQNENFKKARPDAESVKIALDLEERKKRYKDWERLYRKKSFMPLEGNAVTWNANRRGKAIILL